MNKKKTVKKLKIKSHYVSIRTVDGSNIHGNVNLNSETVAIDRLSDFFIKGKNSFIVMYDATIQGKQNNTIIINKANIVWAVPGSDPNITDQNA